MATRKRPRFSLYSVTLANGSRVELNITAQRAARYAQYGPVRIATFGDAGLKFSDVELEDLASSGRNLRGE